MAEYLEPYRQAVRGFGTGFESLLWNSVRTQERRFEAMAQAADLTGRAIADLGSGRADFLAWLNARGVVYGRYVGVEAIDELLAFSRERAERERLPAATFLAADFAKDGGTFARLVGEHGVDTLTFSGSLNTFEEKLAKKTLERAWRAVADLEGGLLMFNFLSDVRRSVKGTAPPAKRFRTVELIRWAFERTPRVVVRHDHLGDHDCLVAMHADGRA